MLAHYTPVVILFILGYYAHRRYVKRTEPKLPPGPLPFPVIGNVLQLPLKYQQRTFSDWAKVYGDVVYVRLFRTPALVIDSAQAAQDLMDKRSSKYSDRPRFVALTEIMGWELSSAFMPYGKRWLKHRQWIQAAYTDKTSLRRYQPVQRQEAYILIAALLDTPEKFLSHLKSYSAALIFDTVFGQTLGFENEGHLQAAMKATDATSEAGSPAATLVDFLSFPEICSKLASRFWLPS